MKKTAVNLLLFLAGTILTYDFYVILTQGKIYPIPNIPIFVVYNVLVLGVLIFALWSYLTYLEAEYFCEGLLSTLLFSLSVELLTAYTILPIISLNHGSPINSYFGHEPNTITALGELSLSAAAGLCGLYGLIRSIFKRLRVKNPA